MTTQEMFDVLMKGLTARESVEIIGKPHKVPHGGIAIDARKYVDNFYSINCIQVYGTEELLADAESILTEEYVSFAPKSAYMKAMKKGMYRKSMLYAAAVRVVPLEEECVMCLLELAGDKAYLGAFLFLRFLKENGQLLSIWDIKDIAEFKRYIH